MRLEHKWQHLTKAIWAGGLALLLAGCATFGNMEKGLNAMIGQPFQVALDTLGYPQGQMQVGSDTVYGWGRKFSMSMPRYNSANTYGQVGGTPYSATTGYTTYSNVEYSCDIKIIVDQDNIIKTWEFDGNIGGCDAYSKRLKPRKQSN